MSNPKNPKRIVWGVLLFAAGLMMFITIPARVREIQESGQYIFGLRFGLYFISVILMVGGGRKLYDHIQDTKKDGDES